MRRGAFSLVVVCGATIVCCSCVCLAVTVPDEAIIREPSSAGASFAHLAYSFLAGMATMFVIMLWFIAKLAKRAGLGLLDCIAPGWTGSRVIDGLQRRK